MKTNCIAALIASAALAHFATAAEDAEKPVKFADLPAAVAKAIKTATDGTKIEGLTEEKEDGVDAFEAVWTVKGRRHEVTVARDGKVLSHEEVIPLEEAPEAVRAAIVKEADGAKVTEVEKVEAEGKVLYEAVIKTAKGVLELKLDAKGTITERETGDGKD